MPAMSREQGYSSAAAWRNDAMQRDSTIDAAAVQQRQQMADLHNRQESIVDADTLRDPQLYIQGKMSLDEYQDYLLFKYSTQ